MKKMVLEKIYFILFLSASSDGYYLFESRVPSVSIDNHTSSPVPTPIPSSNDNITLPTIAPTNDTLPTLLPTISPSPSSHNSSEIPTASPTETEAPTKTPSESPTETPTPPSTFNDTSMPTMIPSILPSKAPSHKESAKKSSIGRIIMNTIGLLILITLSVLLFGAIMSNRYQIYYALRGILYTILQMGCTRWIIVKLNLGRSRDIHTNSSLNEIIFDSDPNEGLLMGDT